MIFLRTIVGWAWASLRSPAADGGAVRIAGPFRVILAVADTAGAVLGNARRGVG